MKQHSLLSFLDVEKHEIKTLLWSFSFSFFQGIVGVILTAVPLALFLGRYSSGLLTYTYIFNGIISFLLGVFLTGLSKRISLFYVLQLPLVFLIVTIIFFLGAIVYSSSWWAYFALVIWSSVNYNLTTFVGMTTLNQLFSLQQGKRFFGIISAGGALGGMIAGLCLDTIQLQIGPINLILLSTGVLFITFLMICSIRSKHLSAPHQIIPSSSIEKKSTFSLKKSRNKKYIIDFFITLFLLTFFYFVLDLLFNHEAKRQFKTESELTAFFGYFFGTLNALTFIFSFFFMAKLLGKFGILNTLFALIAFIGVLTAVTFVMHFNAGLSVAAFWVLAFIRICDNVLRAPLPLPLLNQPLNPQEKVWAQIQEQLTLSPLSTVASGLVLLAIDYFFGVQFFLLAILLIVTALLICITLYYFKKEYTNILMRNIASGSYDISHTHRSKNIEISTVTPFLNSSSEEALLFAMETLKEAKSPEYFQSLEKVLEHTSSDVRLFALQQTRYLQKTIDAQALLKFLQVEKDPKLIALALLSFPLTSEKNLEILKVLDSFRSSKDPDVQSSCLIALFQRGDMDLKNQIRHQIVSYGSSSDRLDKIIAAKFLKECEMLEKEKILSKLLVDPDKEIKMHAIRSVGALESLSLYPILIHQLLLPAFRSSILQSLLQAGTPVIDYIDENFNTFPPTLKEEVIKFLGYSSSEESLLLLEKLLLVPDIKHFHMVLVSLRQHAFAADENNKGIIYQLLEREKKNVLDLKILIEPLTVPETSFLRGLLQREMELGQNRMIHLLSFLFSPQSLMTASAGIASKSRDIRSFAIELLLENLPLKEKNTYLNPITLKVTEETNEIRRADFWFKYFDHLLESTQNRYVKTLASAAIFTLINLGYKEFAMSFTPLNFENDPYFKQMQDLY